MLLRSCWLLLLLGLAGCGGTRSSLVSDLTREGSPRVEEGIEAAPSSGWCGAESCRQTAGRGAALEVGASQRSSGAERVWRPTSAWPFSDNLTPHGNTSR